MSEKFRRYARDGVSRDKTTGRGSDADHLGETHRAIFGFRQTGEAIARRLDDAAACGATPRNGQAVTIGVGGEFELDARQREFDCSVGKGRLETCDGLQRDRSRGGRDTRFRDDQHRTGKVGAEPGQHVELVMVTRPHFAEDEFAERAFG